MRIDIEKAFEAIVAFNSEQDYYALLGVILNKMMEMTNADAGTLYVIEDDNLHFRIIRNMTLNVFQGADSRIDLPPVSLDKNNIENVSAYVAIKNEVVSIDDVYEDKRFNFAGPKNYDKLTGYRTRSMLVFPLTAVSGETQEVIGVIQLINAVDRETGAVISFSGAFDHSILLALSKISANTLANILYAKEIEELFNSFVRVMTKAIDERSAYTVNHANNVARYCGGFCDYLSRRFPPGHEFHFDKNRRDQLIMAALLHDIGKIITPLSIMDKRDRLGAQLEIIRYKFEIKKYQLENEFLSGRTGGERYDGLKNGLEDALRLIEESNSAGFLPDDKIERLNRLAVLTYIDGGGNTVPILTAGDMESLTVRRGTLTAAEREIMQEHVSITERLLDSMKFNKYYMDVPTWAKGHHELLDGTGYPLGLKGNEITTEMRILSILDIYDALVATDRPYKKPMPVKKAQEILLSMANEGKLGKELVMLFIESGVCGQQKPEAF